jgi:hypothetical protein
MYRVQSTFFGAPEAVAPLPCIVIVIAPELGSSNPIKPFAVLTSSELPGKYLAFTRMVPKLIERLELR